MHVGAGTAMYYDCGVAGLGGAYAAQWAPTQGAVPVSRGVRCRTYRIRTDQG